MLKALRHHAVIGGMVEVLVDATRYIAIMLVLLLLLGSSRKSRSEAKGRQPARWREGLKPGPRGELLTQSLSGRCLGERQSHTANQAAFTPVQLDLAFMLVLDGLTEHAYAKARDCRGVHR
jgi:hypothetical protein